MCESEFEIHRRTIIKAAAFAVGTAVGSIRGYCDEATTPIGKPGDFDFLAGEWKIKNRRLKSADTNEWDEFEGEATCWTILAGIGSVEELRIPARKFAGMGLRLLDVEKRVWNDFWVNAKSGVLSTPGQQGAFENGVGTFTADDMDNNLPIKVKGVWDRITPESCRWYQAISRDGGKTWQENWLMDWTRVRGSGVRNCSDRPMQGRYQCL